jgi:uncharacterized Zn-binding protein involved in type VI secretion
MPGIAKKGGSSTVTCTDGAKGSPCAFSRSGPVGWHWDSGTTQPTAGGSSNVFVEGVGVVREGDAMGSHPDGDPCTGSPINHAPTLSTFSGNVFVNGKAVGRVGDKFDSDGHFDHTIATGATTVSAN